MSSSSDDVHHLMDESSVRFYPKRGRSRGLSQPERRIKAKRLQYSGIHPSPSDEIDLFFIEVFDENGEFVLRFGEHGREPGQLARPIDVAETINGNYLISDFDSHCVNVFTPVGRYISRFGQRYLGGPKGLTVDSRGRILVVDAKTCMLCIFKPTGKFINRFGARGVADSQFGIPMYVAVNSQDEILVSDFQNHSIKRFDCNGIFLAKIGVNGMQPGCFHSPTGLAIDSNDNIFVCDWGNCRLQVGKCKSFYI
ncbi:unnamed protein product [Protopolystoma xenopodis]|uniref:SMP-30/Gluconolactonase/LRE-like region domain-containing protein n=1 Tax=Protopolystoma xenopodis TaxID=117903 RepID=A0A448WXZ9_9PLAT|nr:unnamed protein product [Protopolystoma xenopodis]